MTNDLDASIEKAREAKELAESTSEGPWHITAEKTWSGVPGHNVSRYDHVVWGPRDHVCTAGVNEKRQAPNDDAKFIAASRELVPQLADIVIELATLLGDIKYNLKGVPEHFGRKTDPDDVTETIAQVKSGIGILRLENQRRKDAWSELYGQGHEDEALVDAMDRIAAKHHIETEQ